MVVFSTLMIPSQRLNLYRWTAGVPVENEVKSLMFIPYLLPTVQNIIQQDTCAKKKFFRLKCEVKNKNKQNSKPHCKHDTNGEIPQNKSNNK